MLRRTSQTVIFEIFPDRNFAENFPDGNFAENFQDCSCEKNFPACNVAALHEYHCFAHIESLNVVVSQGVMLGRHGNSIGLHG